MKKLNRQELKERNVKSVMGHRRYTPNKGTIIKDTLLIGDYYTKGASKISDAELEYQKGLIEKAVAEQPRTYTITMKLKDNEFYPEAFIKNKDYSQETILLLSDKKQPEKIYNVISWKRLDNGKTLFKTTTQFYVSTGEIQLVERDN